MAGDGGDDTRGVGRQSTATGAGQRATADKGTSGGGKDPPALGQRNPSCERIEITSIEGVKVWRLRSPNKIAFFYKSGMKIDADGAPDAYHPQSERGRDKLDNAHPVDKNRKPIRDLWVGVVTDNGKKSGTPHVQEPADPCPGFFVSPTSLEDKTKGVKDPRRYVDSTRIPYIVMSRGLARKGGAELGDFAVVINAAKQLIFPAIFADIGNAGKIGEGSIALARALGLNSDARRGGTERRDIICIVFPRSGNGRPRPIEQIQIEAARCFWAWGEMPQVRCCFPEYHWTF